MLKLLFLALLIILYKPLVLFSLPSKTETGPGLTKIKRPSSTCKCLFNELGMGKPTCGLQGIYLRIQGIECKRYVEASNVGMKKEIWERNVIPVRVFKADLWLYLLT